MFKEKFNEAHNASADVEATSRVFFELVRKGVFDQSVFKGYQDLIDSIGNDENKPISLLGLKHLNLKEESEKIKKNFKDMLPINILKHQAKLEVSFLENYLKKNHGLIQKPWLWFQPKNLVLPT